ncbi:MAG: DUF4388 domain-containing protein [Syntrophobacteraceae bacterium]
MNPSQKNRDRFDGTIEYVRLIDLIQVSCLAKISHVIKVVATDRIGRFYLDAGKVVHAQSGNSTGEEGFFELIAWEGGHFETEPFPLDVPTSINRAWEYLLLQALQAQTKTQGAQITASAVKDPSHGFCGNIHNISLTDLIQLLCLDSVDRIVEVSNQNFSGTIHVRAGRICHAQIDHLEGQEAFFKILNTPTGSFKTHPSSDECPTTIQAPWELLLMEAMRLCDETAQSADENKAQSLLQKIQEKNVSEKIRLAMFADKETRTILMRDSNRMIQLAVLGNPKLTDSEVAAIACSRQVDEEVLRRIAAHKEWVKTYSVRLALVLNPRTPIPISRRFIPTLNRQDLRNLSLSKSVPSLVANEAKRQMVVR